MLLLKTTEGYNKGSPEVMTPFLPLWSWAEPSGSADARKTTGHRNTRTETAFQRSSSQRHLLDPTDCWGQFPELTTHFDTIYLLNLLVWRVSLLHSKSGPWTKSAVQLLRISCSHVKNTVEVLGLRNHLVPNSFYNYVNMTSNEQQH